MSAALPSSAVRMPARRSADRRLVGPEMHNAATTRPRESTTGVAAAATPLSRSLSEVAHRSVRIRWSWSASRGPGAFGIVGRVASGTS